MSLIDCFFRTWKDLTYGQVLSKTFNYYGETRSQDRTNQISGTRMILSKTVKKIYRSVFVLVFVVLRLKLRSFGILTGRSTIAVKTTTTKVQCPSYIPNGRVSQCYSRSHGVSCYFFCDFGYQSYGSSYIYCRRNGKWNPENARIREYLQVRIHCILIWTISSDYGIFPSVNSLFKRACAALRVWFASSCRLSLRWSLMW